MSRVSIDEMTEKLSGLGEVFKSWSESSAIRPFQQLLEKTNAANPWFTAENIRFAFKAWANELQHDKIKSWMQPYSGKIQKNTNPKTVGVINAGNIPLVGLHDMLCVLLSGNNYLGKNSSEDPFLLTAVAEKIIEISPATRGRITFTDKLQNFDAAIATGSNNSARYFEYYFRNYPYIIRKNRNGVAWLNGSETADQLAELGKDVFTYFGLGCRNVSHLVVPENYDFTNMLQAFEKFSTVSRHHKYMNNYDYYKTILLMKNVPFYDNGFLLLKQDELISSPIAVLNYHTYKNKADAEGWLQDQKENIQCIISKNHIPFGMAQAPALNEYADGIDTMRFLTSLN